MDILWKRLQNFLPIAQAQANDLKHKRIVRNSAETVRFHKIPVFFAVNFTT